MKQTLVISGAGASYSLQGTKKEQSIYHFTHGKLDCLPLGDGLVKRIASYKTKSICWLIAALIHEEIFGYKSQGWNQFFYNLGDSLEKNFPYFGMFLALGDEVAKKIREQLLKDIENKIAESCGGKFNKEIPHLLEASQVLSKKLKPHEKALSRELIAQFILFEIVKNLAYQLTSLLQNRQVLDNAIEELCKIINDVLQRIENLCENPPTGTSINDGTRFTINSASIFRSQSEKWDSLIDKSKKSARLQSEQLESISSDKIKSGAKKILQYADEILALRGLQQLHFNVDNFFGIKNSHDVRSYEELINQSAREKINQFKIELSELIEPAKSNIETDFSDLQNLAKILEIFQKHLPNLQDRHYIEISDDCFKNLAKEILAIKRAAFRKWLSDINSGLKNHKNFEKSLEHLKGCFIAANIVEYYQPYSIDYFMMNIEQLAHFEFYSKTENEIFGKLIGEALEERKKYLHKYTKFIIADIISPSSIYGYIHAQYNNNYFKKLRWKFLEDALFYNKQKWHEKALEEYFLQNVKIITFNYDNSFERIFWENFDITESNRKFIKNNLKHVYGEFSLKIKNQKNEEFDIGSFGENCLWKGLFSVEDGKEIMNISLPNRQGNKEHCKVENIFNQLDENIKWIGSQSLQEIEEDRNCYVEWLSKASEIYILGFGFDMNNLFRIGLTDASGNLNKSIFENSKNIFISGANAKIINQIHSLLNDASFEFSVITINENVVEINFNKNKIILSKSFLPDVFNNDF